MFFRRRREQRKSRLVRRLLVGLIIGGAIASIVGRKIAESEEGEGKAGKIRKQ